MNKNLMLRTHLLVCAIITAGFILTAFIGYRANNTMLINELEHVSSLAADSIFQKIQTLLTRPVHISLTMANDSLLKEFLAGEEQHLDDEAYISTLRDYLGTYKEKYGYDSVFLVSAKTRRYYHFKGLDRILARSNPENAWYYDFLGLRKEYSLNVDNDEAAGDVITVFINCDIRNDDGLSMGVVGVGLRIDNLQKLLKGYDDEFGVTAFLTDAYGEVQISSHEDKFERIDLFDSPLYRPFKNDILDGEVPKRTFWSHQPEGDAYIVTQAIPDLNWYLAVESDTTNMRRAFVVQLIKMGLVLAAILALVLLTITRVIRKYNAQIVRLAVSQELEYQNLLHEATESLYENIYEIDVTHDRAGSEGTRRYFASLGMKDDVTLDEAIRVIAEKQIKPEFVQGYLDAFSREHVLKTYEEGRNSLSCDLMIRSEGDEYRWMRITARLFLWNSDRSLRMITYRQSIDDEKKREVSLLEKARRDSLTGLYNKRTTEEMIESAVRGFSPSGCHAFLIFDIDNFKSINDNLGHAFGDRVIAEFAAELKRQFRDRDIVGRIGGDEFVALMRDYDADLDALQDKLERCCTGLSRTYASETRQYAVSASIGAALAPRHGFSYAELYEKADQALYLSKAHGKSTFHIYGENSSDCTAFRVNQRDIEALLNTATDGLCKIACCTPPRFLYFNPPLAALLGLSLDALAAPHFDALDLFHPEDRSTARKTLEHALPARSAFTMRVRLRSGHGRYRPVRIRGLFVHELFEQKYPVFYAVFTDLDAASGAHEAPSA